MRILMINTVCGISSTGRICTDLAKEFEQEGHQVKIAYGRGNVPKQYAKYAVRIGNDFDVYMHALCSRVYDNAGFNSRLVTRCFLKWAEEFNPDMLWLHNLHGYYINIEELFNWIKKRPSMKVQWTLHDCWAFTGHCVYFRSFGCDKWKERCKCCPQKKEYPTSLICDRSEKNFIKKSVLFTGVSQLQIITPSFWLANLVRESFLNQYPIKVIYNKIDTTVFKPTKGNFRKDYHLEDKKIILGVASGWGARKGLDDFLELSRMLDETYVIVLVGLSNKQIKNMPPNIIGLRQTDSVEELAIIYSTADIFVNPSREETFGMTTLEAVSCGTKAIVYKDTACEEVVNAIGGIAVDQGARNIYQEIVCDM